MGFNIHTILNIALSICHVKLVWRMPQVSRKKAGGAIITAGQIYLLIDRTNEMIPANLIS